MLTPSIEERRTGPLEPFEKRALIGFAIAASIEAILGTWLAAVGLVVVGALWLLRARGLPGHGLAMPAGLLVATAGIYSGYTAMNAPFSGFLSRYSVPILLLLLGALLLFADQEWQFQRSIFVLAAIAFATVQVVLTMEARSGGRPIPPAAGVRTETGGIIGEMEMVQVARSFVDAINAHNPNAIVALTTPDHRFIDSLGNTTPPVKLRAAWHGYFRLITNYHIEVERWISDGTTVMAYGTASGNYNRTDWSIPAAWRAVIRDGKVAEWQVYADNGELRELMKQ